MRSSPDLNSEELAAALGAIDDLVRAELAERWTALTGTSLPKRATAKLLALAIAYELQLRSSAKAEIAEKRIAKLMASPKANSRWPSETTRVVSVGARLLREWRGRTLTVDVVDDGYLFEGATYRSLSAIARRATGAARNGPAFFGLRESESP
jgi:hypothetical protein